jgi:hypothetical protein
MPITRCQSQKQNVFVFPNATSIVYLPDSFYTIIAHFLWHKANGSMYHQNIMKNALIEFCTNFNEGFDVLATKHFPTQCFMVAWCVDVMIHYYISETVKLMSGQLKIKYLCSSNEAKRNWSLWQKSSCIKSNIYRAMISMLSLIGLMQNYKRN